MPKPINIFIIYAREDKEIKQGLLSYLNPFVKPYNLNIWHDAHIQPGQEWKYSIDSRLNQTDLFVMLVSIDFMNSSFIHQVEFKYAVERHKANKSIIIPVITRECPWDIDFEYDNFSFSLKELQVLPDEGRPIVDWKTPDHAFNNIASGIRKVFATIKKNQEQQEALEKDQKASEQIQVESNKKKLEEEEAKKKKEDEEESFWVLVEEENSVEGYQDYLNKYPDGKHKNIALSVIRTLENISKKKQKDEEEILWKASNEKNTIDSYKNYLDKTELGRYKEQAGKLIADIEKKNQEILAEKERQLKEEQDNKLWKETSVANSISSYKKYLNETKVGLFKEKAEQAIKQLEAEQKEKELEQQFWQKTKTENTVNIYNEYLQRYPKGNYRTDASDAIKAIYNAIEKKNQEIKAEKERQLKEEQDNKLWRESSGANTIASYKEYLTETKAGLFKDKAEQAIKQLQAEQKEKELQNQFWQKAKTENTVNIYNEYLQRFPKGNYRTDASNAIKAIEKKNQEIQAEKERLQKEEQDTKLWNEISSANNIASYKKYLTETKAGLFKEKAQQALSQLETEQKEKEIENELWEKTKKEASLEAYNLYLEKYPGGTYSAEAIAAITNIEEAKRKEEAAALELINFKTEDVSKKSKSKKYLLIGGVVILLGAVIFGVTKFKSSSSGVSNNDEPKDSVTLIIKKYMAAVGGKEKLQQLNTIIYEGIEVIYSKKEKSEIEVKTSIINKKAQRIDYTQNGFTAYGILTPNEGWYYSQGQSSLQAMSAEILNEQLYQLDIIPLLDYTEKGHKVEYTGKEFYNGTECLKLKVNMKTGTELTIFFDPLTYYILKEIDKINIQGKGYTNTYSNFSKTPEGYVFPHSRSIYYTTTPFANQEADRVTSFSKIEVNKPIDESLFKPGSSETISIKVGDPYQGGVVFKIDESGKEGLIVAKEDILGEFTWYEAVAERDRLNGIGYNGYSDWRLPTQNELWSIWSSKNVYFNGNDYWSSEEVSSTTAKHLNFAGGGYKGKTSKSTRFKVHFVRDFKD